MVEAFAMNQMMLQEINSQPEILKTAIPDLREKCKNIPGFSSLNKVVLTGSGDSYFAALACERLFRLNMNCEVRSIGSLEASRYERYDAHSLLVGISISGGVTRTIEAAQRASDQGAHTIAIVAKEDSVLGNSCSSQIIMPRPLTRSTPHTRDYTLTLVTLAILLEKLIDKTLNQLDQLPIQYNSLIPDSFRQIPDLMSIANHTWFLGTGADKATAMYGAMKFWEGSAMKAWADDLEEFVHGAKEICQPEDAVVVIASNEAVDRALEMIPGMKRMGLQPWLITNHSLPDDILSFQVPSLGGPEWMPFLSCIPLQVLTYLTAMERGIEATLPIEGDPRSKIMEEIHLEWTKGSHILKTT
jgi:glutamine---fructose-6-phosphate transaminase (isomerizing)